MTKVYYKKENYLDRKKILRLLSFSMLLVGVSIVVYVFLPLLSWEVYFAPVFASQAVTAPIPKESVVSPDTIQTLVQQASYSISGVNYYDAQNWFPNYRFEKNGQTKIQFYTISIPSLKIKNAVVSTVDTNLAKHLVNFGGTAFPPDKGNAVIFGHSTLPWLYDPENYRTVFTYLYKLNPGDEILVNIGNVTYKYKVDSITVVDADNTSVLQQNYNGSYLTLVTCTPPGTIWKRLVVKSSLEAI